MSLPLNVADLWYFKFWPIKTIGVQNGKGLNFLDCKYIGIRQFEFMVKTQFLLSFKIKLFRYAYYVEIK